MILSSFKNKQRDIDASIAKVKTILKTLVTEKIIQQSTGVDIGDELLKISKNQLSLQDVIEEINVIGSNYNEVGPVSNTTNNSVPGKFLTFGDTVFKIYKRN